MHVLAIFGYGEKGTNTIDNGEIEFNMSVDNGMNIVDSGIIGGIFKDLNEAFSNVVIQYNDNFPKITEIRSHGLIGYVIGNGTNTTHTVSIANITYTYSYTENEAPTKSKHGLIVGGDCGFVVFTISNVMVQYSSNVVLKAFANPYSGSTVTMTDVVFNQSTVCTSATGFISD